MNTHVFAFRGRFAPRTEGRAFLDRVARRVEAGFLMGRPHFRSRYAVVSRSGDGLAIRSEGFWTDFNVGLNDISLRLGEDGAVEYEVTFRRWLRACVVLCAVFGIAMLVGYWVPLPGVGSMSFRIRNASAAERAIFWGSLIWWGVAWPWVLAAVHRGPAEGLLRRILGEVDAAG